MPSNKLNVFEQNTQTMTLKEITDLLQVRHNNAVRVVEKMVGDQEFGNDTQIEYRTSRSSKPLLISPWNMVKMYLLSRTLPKYRFTGTMTPF